MFGRRMGGLGALAALAMTGSLRKAYDEIERDEVHRRAIDETPTGRTPTEPEPHFINYEEVDRRLKLPPQKVGKRKQRRLEAQMRRRRK